MCLWGGGGGGGSLLFFTTHLLLLLFACVCVGGSVAGGGAVGIILLLSANTSMTFGFFNLYCSCSVIQSTPLGGDDVISQPLDSDLKKHLPHSNLQP